MDEPINIKPLFGWVLLEPIEEKTTASGIVAPDSVQMPIEKAKVIAVGTGTPDGGGEVIPMSVSVGNIVHFKREKREEVRLNGKDYYYLDQLAIMGVFSE